MRRVIVTISLVACSACDSFLTYGCDERDAAWIQPYTVEAGADEPSCEEVCGRRYDRDEVLACERLLDEAARSTTRRYYCEVRGARGQCHKR
ncbi:MAG: hypothetical protein KF819_04525 [Labilithrix sp.]|nr:hypothetical protein [Labilithrix sp.]